MALEALEGDARGVPSGPWQIFPEVRAQWPIVRGVVDQELSSSGFQKLAQGWRKDAFQVLRCLGAWALQTPALSRFSRIYSVLR